MNYEQKYKEVRGLIEDCIPDKDGYICIRPSDIFPELKESEDERVRKSIVEMVLDTPNVECEKNYNVCKEDALAWLEKQAPKPKWTEEDEAHLHSITTHLEQWIERHPNTCGADIQGENLAWLKTLKQRMEEQQ